MEFSTRGGMLSTAPELFHHFSQRVVRGRVCDFSILAASVAHQFRRPATAKIEKSLTLTDSMFAEG